MTLTLDKDVVIFLRKKYDETKLPISRYIDRLVRNEMQKEKANE